MLPAFRLLAKLKVIRGTWFDIFSRTEERQLERRLIDEYFDLVEDLSANLNAQNHALAVQLASIPEDIRGFGHVKERHIKAAIVKQRKMLESFRAPIVNTNAAD
jgi:indolepyruvate ferredoxin oxidoreductase